MSLFLAIYSHRGELDPKLVGPMLADFGRGRELRLYAAPGFQLATVASAEALRMVSDEGGLCVAGLAGNLQGLGTGALPQTFLRDVDRVLSDAEGAFAVVRYDRAAHSLLLANDPFGVHPLFVRNRGDILIFSSEYAPILADPDLRATVNHDALAEFFGLGLVLGNETLLNGIANLSPGTALRAEGGRVWETACAGSATPAASGANTAESLDDLAAAVASTLRLVMQELVGQGDDVVHLLSGGADTRLMLSCLSELQRSHVEFLTSCVSALDPGSDRDVLLASRLAKRLGLQHRVLRLFFTEIPFGTDVFDREREVHSKRVLGGWHGGEFLGGFGFKAAPISPALDRDTVDRRLEAVFSREFLDTLTRHPFETYRRHLEIVEGNEFAFVIRQFTRPFFSRIYNGSRGAWLQPGLLPSRRLSPFWDSRLLKLLLRVPVEHLRDYKFYNQVFREHFPELTDLPTNSPLARREDGCMAMVVEGIEPKDVVSLKYGAALDEYRRDPATWARGIYSDGMRQSVEDPRAELVAPFVDLEAWLRRYVDDNRFLA
jgi:hypothetical protein